MANRVRLKRRVSGNAGAPATLLNGEVAVNEVDGVVWYGKGLGQDGNATSVIAIGGDGVFATKSYVTTAVSAVDVSSQLANYLTTANAGSTYLTISSASSTYLTQSNASSTYAPLASPTFTGTPASVTPTAGDNSTKIATTAFVSAAVSSLVNGAPEALNTLAELATALNSDASFSTTVSASIGGKLAKASNLSDLADAATARTNLGLGSMSQQSSSNVNITGGSVDNLVIDSGTF
jgi:phage-related tail fiber protein